MQALFPFFGNSSVTPIACLNSFLNSMQHSFFSFHHLILGFTCFFPANTLQSALSFTFCIRCSLLHSYTLLLFYPFHKINHYFSIILFFVSLTPYLPSTSSLLLFMSTEVCSIHNCHPTRWVTVSITSSYIRILLSLSLQSVISHQSVLI